MTRHRAAHLQLEKSAGRHIRLPLIPGHEFCGVVEAVGDEVTSAQEDDFGSAKMLVA